MRYARKRALRYIIKIEKKRENDMEALCLNEILSAVKGTPIWLNRSEEATNEITITKVSTNSRDDLEGGLFVPIIGERVDAHDFIKGAFEHGANAVFTSRHKTYADVVADEKLNGILSDEHSKDKALIVVDDTLKALQELAIYYRNQFQIPVIGISGSVGKTTTKEMISAALETKKKVLKTFGNMNSQIGVALMMFELDSTKDVAVIEMGISEPEEMERLCKIAQPKYAVLTNIGVSHIANLKTRENIRKEKSKIVNAFGEDSILYVNGNDDLLKEIYLEYEAIQKGQKDFSIDLDTNTKNKLKASKVCAFGTEDYCGFCACHIETKEEKTSFTLSYPEGEEKIQLSVCGIHNVYNALVALWVANEFGIKPSVAKLGLQEYQPIKMRGQIFSYGTIKVIDDTYNASPDSMKSGINVLLDLSDVKRRIAVLADVLELGELSEACHYGVGEALAKTNVDVLVTVGSQARFIAKAVREQNANMDTYSYENNEEAIAFLTGFVSRYDGILVKGSRGMKTEQIVEALSKLTIS